MKRILAISAACLLPAASIWADDIAMIEAHTSLELKGFDQSLLDQIREREWQRKAQGKSEDETDLEPLEENDLQAMLDQNPCGQPLQLDDLRREAAEEKGQMAEQNIWEVAQKTVAADMREFVRTYLREVYFRGNASTDVGPFLKKVLEMSNGWKLMPRLSKFGPLPPGIAGLYDGDITLVSPSLVVYSHELLHHLGYGEPGAYGLMGKEFGGGGIAGAAGEASGGGGGADAAFNESAYTSLCGI